VQYQQSKIDKAINIIGKVIYKVIYIIHK